LILLTVKRRSKQKPQTGSGETKANDESTGNWYHSRSLPRIQEPVRIYSLLWMRSGTVKWLRYLRYHAVTALTLGGSLTPPGHCGRAGRRPIPRLPRMQRVSRFSSGHRQRRRHEAHSFRRDMACRRKGQCAASNRRQFESALSEQEEAARKRYLPSRAL